MQRLNSISPVAASRAATLAGAARIADGVLQLLHSQRNAGSRVVGLAGNLNLAFVAIALAATAPCLVVLGPRTLTRRADRRRGRGSGNIPARGRLPDLDRQPARHRPVPSHRRTRQPGVVRRAGDDAVSLVRGGCVRPAIALGLPAAWICAIPLATVGGCALAGAYFLTVGYLLVTHRLEGHGGRRLAAAQI
jgi:hypothetical protein